MTDLVMPDGWDRDRVNETIRYHSAISHHLTSQRTALESALIPITAYILVACVEAYRRYPAMMQDIAAAMPPEQIGEAGRTVGNQKNILKSVGCGDIGAILAIHYIYKSFYSRCIWGIEYFNIGRCSYSLRLNFCHHSLDVGGIAAALTENISVLTCWAWRQELF